MKLIKKYQQGKPILQSDQTQQVPSTTLDKNSEAAQKIKQDAVNAIRTIRGDALHYIFKENPRAFNYNKNLMVRGSELLKYPQIYTHMGWMNTKDSNIIPEQYYRMGTNGSLDPTHYVSFTNSDTYNPINDSYIDYVLNQALTNNKNLGQSTERNKQGSIRQKSNLNINPVFTGFSPGTDAVMYDSSKTDEEKLSAIAQSSAPLTAAVGFTGPSAYIFTPLMMYSGYNKLKNADNWKDYALGAGEITLGSLPFIRPLQQGYRTIRGTFNPYYKLGLETQNAIKNNSLNWSGYYNFTRNNSVTDLNLHQFTLGNTQNALKLPRDPSHIHNSELRKWAYENPHELERLILTSKPHKSTQNIQVQEVKPGYKGNFTFTFPEGKVLTPTDVIVEPDFPQITYRRKGTYDPLLEPEWGYNGKRHYINRGKEKTSKITLPPNKYVYLSDIDSKTDQVFGSIIKTDEGDIVLKTLYPTETPNELLYNLTNQGEYFLKDKNVTNKYVKGKDLFERGHALAEENYTPLDEQIVNPYHLENSNFGEKFIEYQPKQETPGRTYMDEWNNGVQTYQNWINSPEVEKRLRHTGIRPESYRKSVNKALENTYVFDLGYRGEGVGRIGINRFDDVFGEDIFEQLQAKFPELRKRSEEDFLKTLSNEELGAYQRAKNSDISAVLSSDNPYQEQIGIEEAFHRTQYDANDPYLRIVNDYNQNLARDVKARSIQFSDPNETIVRARYVAQKIYSIPESDLAKYYSSRFNQSFSPEQLRELAINDYLRRDTRFIKQFGSIVGDPKTDRLGNQIINQYYPDAQLKNLIKYVVQNNYDFNPINNVSTT